MMDKVGSMLNGARVTQKLWTKVVDMTCYLLNRSFLTTLVDKTPYEAWDVLLLQPLPKKFCNF